MITLILTLQEYMQCVGINKLKGFFRVGGDYLPSLPKLPIEWNDNWNWTKFFSMLANYSHLLQKRKKI